MYHSESVTSFVSIFQQFLCTHTLKATCKQRSSTIKTRKCSNYECMTIWRLNDIAQVVLRCFGQFCTAHAHKLLFTVFQ